MKTEELTNRNLSKYFGLLFCALTLIFYHGKDVRQGQYFKLGKACLNSEFSYLLDWLPNQRLKNSL